MGCVSLCVDNTVHPNSIILSFTFFMSSFELQHKLFVWAFTVSLFFLSCASHYYCKASCIKLLTTCTFYSFLVSISKNSEDPDKTHLKHGFSAQITVIISAFSIFASIKQ